MKKNISTVSLITFFVFYSYGQVQIQPTLPTVGLVQKNQLWNLVLINSTGEILQGRIELVLFNRQTSQELMTATSGDLTVPKGPVIINVNKVSPVIYNYIGIEPDKNINSLLPVGSYSICYSFARNPSSQKRETLTEECVSFDTEPLSPPLLIYPADSAIFETPSMQFSWTPPTPVGLIDKLHYEIVITEMQPFQKPGEALQQNIPFFSMDQHLNNFINYPAASPVFENDKWYAWQVTARDDNNYAGKSEAWVFKISKQNPVQEIINATPYIQLKKNGAEKTIAANGILRFYYFNQVADTAVSLTVSDITETKSGDQASVILNITRGQNYIQKDISKLVKIQEGHLYMLSLQNSAMEKWSILFEVKKY